MRAVEGQAGHSYWQAFAGVNLNWKITASKPVPEHWLTVGSRMSPKSGCGRYSVSPFHSCLNYCCAALESRVKRYCIAYRLDIDFPIIHSNSRQNRSGLIYDLMEPLRPTADKLLYQWIIKTTLKPGDFFETREGVCKVDPRVTSKIVPLLKSLDPDINRVVKEFSSNFKTRLVQAAPNANFDNFELEEGQNSDKVSSAKSKSGSKPNLSSIALTDSPRALKKKTPPSPDFMTDGFKHTKIKSAKFDVPRGCPFQKGQSGNPKGRPKGSRNKATLIAQESRM